MYNIIHVDNADLIVFNNSFVYLGYVVVATILMLTSSNL